MYSIKTLERVITIHLDVIPEQISCEGEWMHVISSQAHLIYRNNRFQKMAKMLAHDSLSFQYPLFALSTENTLMVGVEAGLVSREELFTPEPLRGLVLSKDEEKFMFGWGSKSHTIYGWRLETRNLHLSTDYES